MKKLSHSRLLTVSILAFLPLSFLLFANYLSLTKGPYYLGHNLDPEYAYLFNSLRLLDLKAPCHTDHPGTTLQMIGAMVILIKYAVAGIFSAVHPLPREVLSNSEAYLRAINVTLICLISIADLLAGLLIYAKQKNLLNAGAFQLTPFLFVALLESSWRVSPEPLQIVTAICIAMLLIPAVANKKCRVSTVGGSITLGALIGFGTVTKVTFFPFILLIFLCDDFKKTFYAFASCICSMVLLTLPILPYYGNLAKWFLRLALRTGHYGHGPAGIPRIDEFWNNLQSLFWHEPYSLVLAGSMFALLFIILFRTKGKAEFAPERTWRRLILVLSAIIALQLLITLKHYRTHYMIPSFSLIGLVGFICMSVVDMKVPSVHRANTVKFILSLLLIACVAISIRRSLVTAQSLRNSWIEAGKIEALIGSSYQDRTLVGFYRCSSLPYALAFGNDFSCRYYGDILADAYPESSFYNIWSKSFYDFTGALEPHEILQNLKDRGPILMQGTNSLEKWGMLDQYPLLEVETLYSGSESLYEVKMRAGEELPIPQENTGVSPTHFTKASLR